MALLSKDLRYDNADDIDLGDEMVCEPFCQAASLSMYLPVQDFYSLSLTFNVLCTVMHAGIYVK